MDRIAGGFEFVGEQTQFFQVLLPNPVGLQADFFFPFKTFKAHDSIERKGQLLMVKDVEDDQMLSGEVEVIEPVDEGFFVVQQIGEKNDEAAAIQARGEFIHDATNVGARPVFGAIQHFRDIGDHR